MIITKEIKSEMVQQLLKINVDIAENVETLIEFIQAMLDNGKDKQHITDELSELLSMEDAVVITDWLFDRLVPSDKKGFQLNRIVWDLDPTADAGRSLPLLNSNKDIKIKGVAQGTISKNAVERVNKRLREVEVGTNQTRISVYDRLGSKVDTSNTSKDEASSNDLKRRRGETVEKPIKCTFYPRCGRGSQCSFWHPKEPCKAFPDCSEGDSCLFIHPEQQQHAPVLQMCLYGEKCNRLGCKFAHPASFTPTPAKTQCRFFPNCLNPGCPFYHPNQATQPAENQQSSTNNSPLNPNVSPFIPQSTPAPQIPCRFDPYCSRPNCHFAHPSRKAFGNKSLVVAAAKPFVSDAAKHISERGFIIDDEETEKIPVASNSSNQ